MLKPEILSDEQISYFLDSYNPAIRNHDGKTFAIEVANVQRDKDWKEMLEQFKEWLKKHAVERPNTGKVRIILDWEDYQTLLSQLEEK